MRLKVAPIVLAALALSSAAYADIVITFANPVSTVSFYSSEPFGLDATTNGATGLNLAVNSGYTLGAVTPFADTNVTRVDFSGVPGWYVLDDFTYSVGGNTYTVNFDSLAEGAFVNGQYAGRAGHPVFSGSGGNAAIVLTYPDYNWVGYPPSTYPNVIYEGPTPEPGTLAMLATGVIAIAGVLRRNWNA
jgi:hypothetical protein